MQLWPWQRRALVECCEAIDRGHASLCVSMPTGSGKSLVQQQLARRCAQAGLRVVLCTNRKIITRQQSDALAKQGIDHGILAHGYDANDAPVQIVSIQTAERRRALGGTPAAQVAIVDECHGAAFDWLIADYRRQAVPVIGFTATPVDMAGRYDRLYVGATKRECREHGALVPCDVYAPDEPDRKTLRRKVCGDYWYKGKLWKELQYEVLGSILEHWHRLNPWHRPTLLFAPGVPESRWFVEEFQRHGVAAEHLDGETPEADRQRILEASKAGDCKIISSCGVLREGFDAPWIEHGILVQICGKLSTYLQIVGRLLRAYPGKERAVLQDHAGCYWRHGSPNLDVDWRLDTTDKKLAEQRKFEIRERKTPEPIRCPKCAAVRSKGPACPKCGYQHTRSIRMVRTIDGQLVRQEGELFSKAPVIEGQGDLQRHWTSCLFAAAHSGRTLMQALGHFCSLTKATSARGLHPNPHELMSMEWSRPVVKVYPWLGKKVG